MSDNTAVLEHVKESAASETNTTRAILSGPGEDTPDHPAWFRQQRGYQTRINAILRSYMQAHASDTQPS